MSNRRNYYRILQVQPDADDAVIRASYRTLLQTLRRHPDLGGDAAEAALINEAYAVLSDARRRAEYDAGRLEPRAERRARGGASAQPGPSDARSRERAPPGPCPFCRGHRGELGRARCASCAGPLTPPEPPPAHHRGARGSVRIEREMPLEVLTRWPQAKPLAATVEDLSPLGMRFRIDVPLAASGVVQLRCTLLDALAEVVAVAPAPRGGWSVRTAFVGVTFKRRQGGLVTAEA